jgi:hypothetical protein
VEFDINDIAVNGSLAHPIPVDATQDLVLEFEPPRDELGDPITGMDYSLQFFYYDDFGSQLDVDASATWTELPDGVEAGRTVIGLPPAELGALLDDGLYAVTVPKECFAATIETKAGETEDVDIKIDVTAECSSGNAAIMLAFRRE